MSMSRYGLDNILNKMVNVLGVEQVLLELTRALTTDELEDNLEFISRMNDLELFSEEDED